MLTLHQHQSGSEPYQNIVRTEESEQSEQSEYLKQPVVTMGRVCVCSIPRSLSAIPNEPQT